jgi:hypothetical protein
LLATVSSLLILSAVPYLESKIRIDWYSDISVEFKPSVCSVDLLVKSLVPLSILVKGVDIEEDLENDRCLVVLHVRYKRAGMVEFTKAITGLIREVPGVLKIAIKS